MGSYHPLPANNPLPAGTIEQINHFQICLRLLIVSTLFKAPTMPQCKLQNTQKHNFQSSHPHRGNPIFKQKYTPESQGALVGSLLESENWGGNSAGGIQGRWRREGGDLHFWGNVKVKVFRLSFRTFSLVWDFIVSA